MPFVADLRAEKTKHLLKGPGRRWGSRNRIPLDLKRAVIDAAIAHGADGLGQGGLAGYGFFLASRHPKAFCGLLGKLLPLQIDGSIQNVVAQVNVVSVPACNYFSQDQAVQFEPLRIASGADASNLDQDSVEPPRQPK